MGNDAPDMIVFGGRAEANDPERVDAVTRFNRMAVDDPRYGHNMILDRIASFDNSARFTTDEEEELDKYVQTLFLEPLGNRGYDLNGECYGDYQKEQAASAGLEYQEENCYAENAADFLNSFGMLFAD